MSDNVRDEFLAEAQEIIESLSRDLLLLDQAQKESGGDPDLVNEVFRAVHTLKGIAGMFGYGRLGEVERHRSQQRCQQPLSRGVDRFRHEDVAQHRRFATLEPQLLPRLEVLVVRLAAAGSGFARLWLRRRRDEHWLPSRG